MINSVSHQHVHQLLSIDTNVVFTVPMYQREYSWTRAEWDELFDDLLEAEGDHFLGTIICINTTADAAKESTLELVDGQQRMTTLSLLLAAVYSELLPLRDSMDDDDRLALLNLKNRVLLKKTDRARLRPQTQGSNDVDYVNVLREAGFDVKSKPVPYAGNRRVMKCFRHFRHRIEEMGDDLTAACWDVLDRVERAVIVKLEVASHSDAFVLFESLNNRGMPLTPIDLVKNKLLSVAEKSIGTQAAFDEWSELLDDLGDDYAAQERFFRQFYNAFRESLPPVPKASVATRSNLIRIYETLLSEDLPSALDRLRAAGRDYRRIIGRRDPEEPWTGLDADLLSLSRAQGAPSYILLLRIMERLRTSGDIDETAIGQTVRVLICFFVRRNLTGVPQTYGLPRLFMDIGAEAMTVAPSELAGSVEQRLAAVSADDDVFRERLRGPVYAENVDVARFVLTSLAEAAMTKETHVDLWAYDDKQKHYVWTIEHILPQGDPLPRGWVQALGGQEKALSVQRSLVHTLGNLTVSGYNSQLSNKSFEAKRDRTDAKGRPIGYRNGLSLNRDVVDCETWGPEQIKARTERLAEEVFQRFPLRRATRGG